MRIGLSNGLTEVEQVALLRLGAQEARATLATIERGAPTFTAFEEIDWCEAELERIASVDGSVKLIDAGTWWIHPAFCYEFTQTDHIARRYSHLNEGWPQ